MYPSWTYYPSRSPAPHWVNDFVDVVAAAQETIDSRNAEGLTSDKVLAVLRPGLENLGYTVESGKRAENKIHLPVLFGRQGAEVVAYEVDAVHRELGVVVEIEAGRGARGNAVYRDLVRASLIVGARFLVIGVMLEYRINSGDKLVHVRSYEDSAKQMDAIYASGRLGLPFEGLLLFGY